MIDAPFKLQYPTQRISHDDIQEWREGETLPWPLGGFEEMCSSSIDKGSYPRRTNTQSYQFNKFIMEDHHFHHLEREAVPEYIKHVFHFYLYNHAPISPFPNSVHLILNHDYNIKDLSSWNKSSLGIKNEDWNNFFESQTQNFRDDIVGNITQQNLLKPGKGRRIILFGNGG